MINTHPFTVISELLSIAQPLQESAPKGFIAYRDGLYNGYVRTSDGTGLRDLHRQGECPSDCSYCKGEKKINKNAAAAQPKTKKK